jgi:hypothetical protein
MSEATGEPPAKWAYFIREGEDGPIKVGHATDPEVRPGQLQVGNSRRLTLIVAFPGGSAREQELLREHAVDRLVGEWLEPTPRVLAAVAAALVEPGSWTPHDRMLDRSMVWGPTALRERAERRRRWEERRAIDQTNGAVFAFPDETTDA